MNNDAHAPKSVTNFKHEPYDLYINNLEQIQVVVPVKCLRLDIHKHL
jgi:hypothetical protein